MQTLAGTDALTVANDDGRAIVAFDEGHWDSNAVTLDNAVHAAGRAVPARGTGTVAAPLAIVGLACSRSYILATTATHFALGTALHAGYTLDAAGEWRR